MEEIKKIWGVQSVKPRLWGYYYDATNGANYTLMVAEDLPEDPGKITSEMVSPAICWSKKLASFHLKPTTAPIFFLK